MQEDLETGRDEPEFGGDSEQNTAAAFYSTGPRFWCKNFGFKNGFEIGFRYHFDFF